MCDVTRFRHLVTSHCGRRARWSRVVVRSFRHVMLQDLCVLRGSERNPLNQGWLPSLRVPTLRDYLLPIFSCIDSQIGPSNPFVVCAWV